MPKPAYRWVPKHTHTNGDLAVEVGNQLGLPPDEDQQDILNAIYATDPDGTPTCFEVQVVAPRQNLKTSTLEVAALTDLYVFEEPLHIWTAHKFDTAQKTYLHMKRLIEANDDFRSRTKFHDANGDEAIELLPGGQLIEFHARSKGAGRGATGSKVTLDEALYLTPSDIGSLVPTLATIPDAQIRYGSSAGLVTSDVLRGVRNRGRKGKVDSLAYFEWCAPVTPCAQEFCLHSVGTSGCALDNEDLLRQANPAYGRRITAERLRQFRQAMPPEEFAREFLGWWDDPPDEGGSAIASADWKACLDTGSRYSGNGHIALGLHVSGDRSTSFLVAVGEREDGLAHAEMYEPMATSRAVGFVKAKTEQHRCAVFIDGSSHANSLVPDLDREKVPVKPVALPGFAQGVGMVLDTVSNKGLRHLGQPPLDEAAMAAAVKPSGRDAWIWDGTRLAPLKALTLALYGYATDDQAYDLGESVW